MNQIKEILYCYFFLLYYLLTCMNKEETTKTLSKEKSETKGKNYLNIEERN